MVSKALSILGLVAVVASAGCATTRTVSTDSTGRTDVVLTAAPDAVVVSSMSPSPIASQTCEHGWFDHAAGVCDPQGE